jgi:hypothetical protein
MRSDADVVISVGPIYTQAEHDALFGQIPWEVQPLRVLIDARLSVTWGRPKPTIGVAPRVSATSTKRRTLAIAF